MGTKSESLLEEYCDTNGVPWERIPVSIRRTPDYKIVLRGVEVACEVKQIEASDDERRALQRSFESGRGVGWWPSNQLRRKLKDSAQLREASSAGRPTMLVVYDNGPFRMALQHERVVEALFGQSTYVEWLSDDPGIEPIVRGPFFGGDRGLTPTQNTCVSAVAILELMDGGLSLRVYHNPHAAVILEPALFDGLPIQREVLPGDTAVSLSHTPG